MGGAHQHYPPAWAKIEPVPRPLVEQPSGDPLNEQVGGDHYKTLKIQPIEYIMANSLGFVEGNIVKYITRYSRKAGAEDVRKVIHYAQILLADLEKRNG